MCNEMRETPVLGPIQRTQTTQGRINTFARACPVQSTLERHGKLIRPIYREACQQHRVLPCVKDCTQCITAAEPKDVQRLTARKKCPRVPRSIP